tara:strand:+ start:157 stop:1080 length:924 start_codon:yes stop_codon:yes gene_type:complete
MAGLTTTQTFSDGDTVTAAKLNNIVSNCSIDADAVTTAKILNANVTLAKMATNSVDTGQLVGNSVSNAKLAGMTRGTVKVGNASGAASDLDAKTSNAFLSGDGTDIKSKTFDSGTAGDITITSTASNFYLEIASNSIANAMVKDDAINPAKISHSSDSNPGVIVYGASGVPAELTTTANPAVLTSAGSSAPSWKTHNKTVTMGNVPAAGSYVLAAHGCGAAPVSVDFFLQCTTNEHNFVSGDRLWKKASYWDDSVCTFGADGTNVWYATHATNSLKFYDKPGGTSGTSPGIVSLTPANWDLYAVVGT